jgi:dTDP-glucose pyrophosphorylase
VGLVLQPQRLGIADAVCRALPLLGSDEAFLACACDSLFQSEDIGRMLAAGQRCPKEALVAVLEMGAQATETRSAVLLESDRVVEIIEKPLPGTVRSETVAAPLYWLPADTARFLAAPARPGKETYVTTALNQFIRAGGMVRALRLQERLEITTPADADAVAAVLR